MHGVMAIRNVLWNVTSFRLLCILVVCSSLASLGIGYFVRKQKKLAAFAKLHGCAQPTSRFPSSPFTGGLDYVLSFIPHIRRHRFAERSLELFDQLGPTFVHSVFGKYVVHTIDPENLKAVLATNASDYVVIPARTILVKNLYGDGIVGNNGHEWSQSRYSVRQAIKAVPYDVDVFEKHAEYMINDIRRATSRVEFRAHAWRYTVDLISECYFGESTRSSILFQAERSTRLAAGFAFLGDLGRSVTLFGQRIPLALKLFYPGWNSKKQIVESIIDTYIQESTAKDGKPALESQQNPSETHRIILQSLAEATNDTNRTKAEIMNLMLAGAETTYLGLGEILWLLSRHEHVWRQLRLEVQDAFHGRRPDLHDLKKLQYLKAIIDETLRVRPNLSVHGRYTARDTVLPRGGGANGDEPILVPKDSYVLYSNYALRRNAAVYGPDVETFRPERWHGLNVGHYEFMSFGAGARVCPGEKLGYTMMAYALVRLAQEFESVSARDDRPWEETTAFSYSNKWGAWVEFKGGEKSVEEWGER